MSEKREQLVATAAKLFRDEGFRTVGIDRILSESGVAKRTLYAHFRSKDELILAVLRRSDESFRNWLMREVKNYSDDPRDRLIGLFDIMHNVAKCETFTGCLFQRASAEFMECNCAARAAILEHKRLVGLYITELCQDAGAQNPTALAKQISVLVNGAIMMMTMTGDHDFIIEAKNAAQGLLDLQLRTSAAQ
ncbi:TetR/AcrR family transcriptional regulator [Poriferisphaera sp. WC338]|uniref:TetR/AcrR family transcriptional regulator n=1 Tax=Poriferisphaera sp. WC338 TaxID=3425129 RepID=UPI003D819408